jgi:quercetin dioxygenase-like cupin family protein
MKINADLSQRAVVHSEELPWIDSPLPGVQRRMLERDGGEVARATSIVRYAPDSRFVPHTHGGGEEFLVLDGVFSDEHGDFGPGMYVRNPPGSRHTPRSAKGCTILVKLRQMAPEDQEHVRIDTTRAPWQPGPVEGASVMPLFERARALAATNIPAARRHSCSTASWRMSSAGIPRGPGCATRRAAHTRRSAIRAAFCTSRSITSPASLAPPPFLELARLEPSRLCDACRGFPCGRHFETAGAGGQPCPTSSAADATKS